MCGSRDRPLEQDRVRRSRLRILAAVMALSSLGAPGIAALAEQHARDVAAAEHARCDGEKGSSGHQEPAGDPCPEGCACYCCPGHAKLLTGAVVESPGEPPATTRPRVIALDDLNPRLHLPLIFRPPRA